jgi:3',5'-cyclic AMP phosphodiesterase CpdA
MINMRFIVIADTHFVMSQKPEALDEIWWNRVLHSQSYEIGESLVKTVSSLHPDFIIHCGDFTEAGDLESFEMGRQIMKRIRCPIYLVVGNHDGGGPWYKINFSSIKDFISKFYRLPHGRCYYSYSVEDLFLYF